nr:MAG TPA: hypothetical protein [Caudoviricetes sp.]
MFLNLDAAFFCGFSHTNSCICSYDRYRLSLNIFDRYSKIFQVADHVEVKRFCCVFSSINNDSSHLFLPFP